MGHSSNIMQFQALCIFHSGEGMSNYIAACLLLLYEHQAYTLNATANAKLFKVLFLGNGLRYLFEILDFEVCDFSDPKMVKTFIQNDRLPMHVSHVQLFDIARGNEHN